MLFTVKLFIFEYFLYFSSPSETVPGPDLKSNRKMKPAAVSRRRLDFTPAVFVHTEPSRGSVRGPTVHIMTLTSVFL